MKKILTIAVASLAIAAVADNTYSPQIGVTTLNLTQKNNIIPVQFTSLAGSGNVAADALVCTNNIPLGSNLYIYQDNAYTAWTLGTDGWEARDIEGSAADGIYSKPGVPAENQVLAVGSAIWLSLNGSTSATVSFYGKVASSTNSTIEAGKCNLLANPTSSSVDIIAKIGNNASAGDVIRLVGSQEQISRNGKNNDWGKFDPNANSGMGGIATVTSLEVSSYQGFWYYSKGSGNITINW